MFADKKNIVTGQNKTSGTSNITISTSGRGKTTVTVASAVDQEKYSLHHHLPFFFYS
ncbi:MAG: hypothetical protein WAM14_10225 [Candidatus Nitrosopolaris sp.]